MTDDRPPLPDLDPATFEVPTLEAWRAAVRAGTGKDAAALSTRLPDDLLVPVLSTADDAVGGLGAVDSFPYRRGDGGLGRRETGWRVGAWIDTGSLDHDLTLAEAAVLGGATALRWSVPRPAAASLAALAARVGTQVRLVADGATAAEIAAAGFEGAVVADVAREASLGKPAAGVRPWAVDTVPVAEAGGAAVQELAWLLASGAELLRALDREGRGPDALVGRVVLHVAVQDETFAEVAKLRAVRWLWAKLVGAAGGSPDAARAELVAVSSRAALSVADPWTNVLRASHAAFVGAVAGADVVVPACWDRALGAPEAAAARLSATLQAVLRDESRLADVADPAGGAWLVESLTDRLARAAWETFREIEASGGALAVRESWFADRVAAARRGRDEAVATRRRGLVGVSVSANPIETLATLPERPSAPLAAARASAPWEALRSRVEAVAPTVVLALLGDATRWRAREGFCRPLLEAGGFRVVSAPLVDGRLASPPPSPWGVVLCGHDDDYPAAFASFAASAKGAGFVAVAGRPGDHEAAFRAAGLTHAVVAGKDVLALLGQLAAAVGVP